MHLGAAFAKSSAMRRGRRRNKLAYKYWSKEEKEYLFKHAKTLHPEDILPELNAKFGNNRTYKAITAILTDNKVPYKHLLPPPVERAKVSIPLDEEGMRKELSKMGYKVEKREEAKADRRVKIDTSIFEGDKYKFAVISCSHLGNKWQQLTHLKSFYQYIQEEGIKVVLHTGDFVDGINVYRGHEYEVFIHGAEAQKDYAIEHYPKMENGGKTFCIGGNHDYSFIQKAGSNVLKGIAQERSDIEYLGEWGAYPQVGPLNIYIHHGSGGTAYADSYKLQKNIENFSPENKPDVYFLGHFHKWCFLSQYRNVMGVTVGSFEAQTPYAKRNNWQPQVAGLIVEITVNQAFRKNSIAQFNWRMVPFFVPVELDY